MPLRWGIGGTRAILVALAVSMASGAQATSVRQLVEAPSLSGLKLSPDGRSIAVRVDRADIAGNRYHLQWLRIDLATRVAEQAGSGGDAVYRDPGLVDPGQAVWAQDSSRFYYRAFSDGAIGIWQSASSTDKAGLLLVKPANVAGIEAGGDGRLIYSLGPDRAAVLAAEAREYREGVRVDARVDLAQSQFHGGWVEGRLGAQRLAGHWFSREGLIGGTRLRRFLLDPRSGREQALPSEPPATPGLLPTPSWTTVAADGLTAVVGDDESRPTITVTGRAMKRRWQSDSSGDRIVWQAWRPGKRQLLFVARDPMFRDRLYGWDMASGRVRLLVQREGLLAGDSQQAETPCAMNERVAVCIAADPLGPPMLLQIDLASARQTTLFDPNRVLRQSLAARARRLTWTGNGTGPVSGILLRPAKGQRHPLFISFYRCPGWLKGGEGGEWPFAALIEAGFAVACLNTPRETKDYDAPRAYRTAYLAISELVEDMARRGEIDANRVGMGGLSFGSEVTMWVMTHSNLLRAASIASTQVEPAYYWFNAGRGRTQPDMLADVWGIGAPDATPERWSDLAPAKRTDRIGAPLLLQLPEYEARLMPEFHARLSRLAVPTESYLFPDETHVKVQPAHQWQVMERNLDWFRFWLLGEKDADPDKRDQYARWEALKARKSEPLPTP